MTSLPLTQPISFGQWTPAPLADLDLKNSWPAFSLRVKKDLADPDLENSLKMIIRGWRMIAIEQSLFDGMRETMTLENASEEHLVGCVRADEFSPRCVNWAADRLGVPVWHQAGSGEHSLLSYWANSSAAAYSYLTNHPDAPQDVISAVRDIRAKTLAERSDNRHDKLFTPSPEGGTEAYTLEVLKDVWANRPQVLQEKLQTAMAGTEKPIDDWARSLLHAIAQEDKVAADILVDPNKLGRRDVLIHFLTDTCTDMTYLNILWWNRFLAEHPECRKAWMALDGTKEPFTAYVYESPTSRTALGREFFPRTSAGNNKHVKVAYSTNMTETHILNGQGSKDVLAMMASHPSGRAEIVRAVQQDVVLKMLLENQNTHGIGPAQLLAWGGQAIRAWRDKNGCCLGHYAVSVTSTQNNADLEAMRMIRWAPEWRDVVPKNEVEIADLVTQPKNKAAFDRSSMRVAVGGQKAGAVVVQKRRM